MFNVNLQKSVFGAAAGDGGGGLCVFMCVEMLDSKICGKSWKNFQTKHNQIWAKERTRLHFILYQT